VLWHSLQYSHELLFSHGPKIDSSIIRTVPSLRDPHGQCDIRQDVREIWKTTCTKPALPSKSVEVAMYEWSSSAREAQHRDGISASTVRLSEASKHVCNCFKHHIDREYLSDLDNRLIPLSMGGELGFWTVFLTSYSYWSVFGLAYSLVKAWKAGSVRKLDRYDWATLLARVNSLSCSHSV
jgi:hypothetical protein